MAEFMGYEVGGLATGTGDLYGYEVVARATAGESHSGDDVAILGGPMGPAEFTNGTIVPATEGQKVSILEENDYIVRCGRWEINAPIVIKLVTAAGINASAVADVYTYGDYYGDVSWSGSVDNCDSDGEGRVFIRCTDPRDAEYIASQLDEDENVISYDYDV